MSIGYKSYAHNGYIDEDTYKALSPEEQEKYFEASGLAVYFLKDTTDGTVTRDTYLNTAVGTYSRAAKHGTTVGGVTSAEENGTSIGTYAAAMGKVLLVSDITHREVQRMGSLSALILSQIVKKGE